MRIIAVLAVCCLLRPCPPALAVESAAGFRFLELPSSAGRLALAGVAGTMASGPDAVASNPAGLALAERTRIQVDYLARPLDLRSGEIGIGPLPCRSFRLGFRFFYLTTPEIQVTDRTGDYTGESFHAGEFLLGAAVARRLTDHLCLGTALSTAYSAIDDRSARALALDLGLTARSDFLSLRGAAVLRHFELSARDYYGGDFSLPAAVSLGGSLQPLPGKLTVALDYSLVRDRQASLTIGGQVRPLRPVLLNFSYVLGRPGGGPAWPADCGPGFGFGLELGDFEIEYAFRDTRRLGTESAIGLTVIP